MSDMGLELQRQINDLQRKAKEQSTWENPNYINTITFGSFLALPALRAFWPFSSVTESATVIDMSGQGRTLTPSGAMAFAVMAQGGAYASLGGSSYFYRNNEAGLQITTAMTWGGWYYMTNTSATRAYMTKYTAAGNQIAYGILYSSITGNIEARVSGDGAAVTTATSTVTPGDYVATWAFIVGVYDPSTRLTIRVNSVSVNNTTSIPAAIFNSSANLLLGGINAAVAYDGRLSMSFICSYPLSDAMLENLYQNTRAMYGV